MIILCACGGLGETHDAGTVRALKFKAPQLCLKPHTCCWISPYDGVECQECCE
jgi:hypothetical protein